jgi:L-fuculose-phosphate aldolase
VTDALRAEICHTVRALRDEGLLAGSQGNISTRCGEGTLITPTGVRVEDLTPGTIVELGPAGEVVGHGRPSGETPTHLGLYRARPDAQAVVHTHGPWSVAWSFSGVELALDTEDLELYGGGPIQIAPHHPSGSDALAEAVVAALGPARHVVLMERHGLVAIGSDLAEAFDRALVIERLAQVAWLVRGL